MDDNELVMAEIRRVANDIDKGFGAIKVREGDLAARLAELEQRAARSGAGGAGGAASGKGLGLGEAAEALVRGLKDAASARTEMAMGIKSLSSTATGALGTTQFQVPITNLAPVDVYHSPATRLLDLLPGEPVAGTAFQYTRVSYAVNNAGVAPELSAKSESTLSTQHVVVEVPTWAHFINCSRQVLADATSLQALLISLLQRGLLDKADIGAFAALTTAGNFTAYVPTANDSAGDAVARIAAQIVALGGRDVVVALNPLDFLAMQLRKAVGSGEYLGLPPETLASRVAAVASVTVGHILAFSPTTGAAYADRQSVMTEAGYTGDGFTMNRATLLCEARGLAFTRDPSLVAYGALPA